MSDHSEYTDTGFRDRDRRDGFGDDMGTRVGRPDGAQEAPRDATPGRQQPGQPGTNTDTVAGGLEGSIMDGDEGGSGPEQSRVQAASEDVNRPAGDNRRVDNL